MREANLRYNLAPKHKLSSKTTQAQEATGLCWDFFLQTELKIIEKNNNNGLLSSARHKEIYKDIHRKGFLLFLS